MAGDHATRRQEPSGTAQDGQDRLPTLRLSVLRLAPGNCRGSSRTIGAKTLSASDGQVQQSPGSQPDSTTAIVRKPLSDNRPGWRRNTHVSTGGSGAPPWRNNGLQIADIPFIAFCGCGKAELQHCYAQCERKVFWVGLQRGGCEISRLVSRQRFCSRASLPGCRIQGQTPGPHAAI